MELLDGIDVQCPELPTEEFVPSSENADTSQVPTPVPELNPDVLAALGEVIEDTPKFGPNIHTSLANLWQPILRKGLDKEAKDKLLKQNPVPENCPLLQAPKLNPEILAALSESARTRDKRVQSVQQQLGAGITALNKGLDLLLESDSDRLLAVKHLSDSSRLLCDLHFVETEARKKFVTPGLDKSFLNIVQDAERDDTLFGGKLSEKIKASKAIEKQGLQIKKFAPALKSVATPTPQPSSSRSRQQGNWTSSPRFPPSSRGGGEENRRGLHHRPAGQRQRPKPGPKHSPSIVQQITRGT